MDETTEMEVRFDIYCQKCKYGPLDEHKDPCNDCLDRPSNVNSRKPIRFKEKE